MYYVDILDIVDIYNYCNFCNMQPYIFSYDFTQKLVYIIKKVYNFQNLI